MTLVAVFDERSGARPLMASLDFSPLWIGLCYHCYWCEEEVHSLGSGSSPVGYVVMGYHGNVLCAGCLGRWERKERPPLQPDYLARTAAYLRAVLFDKCTSGVDREISERICIYVIECNGP